MENLDLFTPVEEGLPKENNLGLSEWMQVCMFGRYSEIGRIENGKWVDKYGKTINVTHYLDLSKLTTKEKAIDAIKFVIAEDYMLNDTDLLIKCKTML